MTGPSYRASRLVLLDSARIARRNGQRTRLLAAQAALSRLRREARA
jgi:hypothetical protein